MTARRGAWVAGAALVLAACGGDAQQTASGMVVSSDPELRAMAEALLPDLARRSGLELKAPVRLEMRSRDELVRYLRFKLSEELPEAEAQVTVASYAMLGLVPESLDLRGVLLALYTEQVAGFYEPDSTALFVLDDQPEQALQGLLVHELVHAVQDQSADLDALTDPELGNDRATAAQAAIEGHATLVMLEYLTEQMQGAPVDLGDIPDFASTLRPALEGMRAQFPALADAPPVIQESLLFPYLEGAGYVQRLWTEGERVAPFGPFLPQSTEQILSGDRADVPAAFVLDVEGVDVVHVDDLGRLELGVLLEHHAGTQAGSAARGWGGDRYALVEAPDGTRGLVLATVWDTAAERDAFVRSLGSDLSKFPAPATLVAVESEVGPAALLSVGAGQDAIVRFRAAPAGP
ncbi:MAG: hypothetical protein RJQ04_08635 [Longimicrobiales bacterium]